MDVEQVIDQLQEATDADRGKVLAELFPEAERTKFAQAVTNAATVNASGVLTRQNEALARCAPVAAQ